MCLVHVLLRYIQWPFLALQSPLRVRESWYLILNLCSSCLWVLMYYVSSLRCLGLVWLSVILSFPGHYHILFIWIDSTQKRCNTFFCNYNVGLWFAKFSPCLRYIRGIICVKVNSYWMLKLMVFFLICLHLSICAKAATPHLSFLSYLLITK